MFVISGFVCIMALRHNNLTAIYLHDQVTQTDREDGNVTVALNTLRKYVYSHMNTNLSSGPDAIYPPVQLSYTYNRLVAAEQASVTAENSGLYTKAENYCQATIPDGFSGRYRVACIQNYITQNGAKVQAIPASLYKFDFQPPAWSPDLAGWSLVVTVILFIAFVVRLGLQIWLKRSLKRS
jgi:hypothetical protein